MAIHFNDQSWFEGKKKKRREKGEREMRGVCRKERGETDFYVGNGMIEEVKHIGLRESCTMLWNVAEVIYLMVDSLP